LRTIADDGKARREARERNIGEQLVRRTFGLRLAVAREVRLGRKNGRCIAKADLGSILWDNVVAVENGVRNVLRRTAAELSGGVLAEVGEDLRVAAATVDVPLSDLIRVAGDEHRVLDAERMALAEHAAYEGGWCADPV